MGNIIGAKVPQRKARYNENIMPVASGLNGDVTINKTGGTAFSVAQYQTNYRFEGTKGVQSYNNSISTPLEYNFGDALSTTIPKTGNYIFSLELLHLDTTVFENKLKVIVYVNEVATHVIENILVVGDEGIKKDVFHTFAQSFTFNQNDVIDFSFEHTVDPTSFIGESTIYFDALKLEIDDRGMQGIPSVYSKSVFLERKEVFGVYDYNDLATQTTPLNYTGVDPFYITNDGLGISTNKTYKLTGIDDVYNTTTNAFDFSGLELGDTVDIRLDLDITTNSPSQVVKVIIELGIGASPYQLTFSPDKNYKSTGTYLNQTYFNSIYIGDSNTKDNEAKFIFESDDNATIVVNGWYVRTNKRLV
jgi:hypothetical protein